MKYHIEELALVIVIKDENGNEIEEFYESERGRFPSWNEYTRKRANERLQELNSLT